MILIIAEKPSVAKELAAFVGAEKRDNGFYSGKGYLVSWCVGHLVQLALPETYGEQYVKWNLETLPLIPEHYQTEVNKNTYSQFKVLKELMNRPDVSELIEATDAGREGELIFRLVYNKIGCKKPFRRLWISSMEDSSIRHGLETLKSGHEYDNLYYAAVCRQRADWLIGMNLSRLYSVMYNQNLKCGRVQTPTVNLIVKRQREMNNFVPQTYYGIIADLGSFKAQAKVESFDDANMIIRSCSGQKATVISAEKQNKRENAAALYDLTMLQRDANRIFGYSAQQTLDYMQKLYDNKLATYPRTDSRYITADQEASTRNLIDKLLTSNVYDENIVSKYNTDDICMQQIVNDKKVTDHHAILPTRNVNQDTLHSLPSGEHNILILILYRLLSAVYAPFLYTATKVILDIEGISFTAAGKEITQVGFRIIDAFIQSIAGNGKTKNEEDYILPPLEKNKTLDVLQVSAEERKTKPPKPYTEDTLLSAMETAGKKLDNEELREAMKDSGLGTPATRASIIENIIKTGYIKRDGKKLLPTMKAMAFMDIVTDKIKEPTLTAEWEKQLASIQKGYSSPKEFMSNITDFIRSFVDAAKSEHHPDQTQAVFSDERKSIGICPKCGKNVLEYPKTYSCESGKDGCGFTVWKAIAKKNITIPQVEKLLKNKKTGLIKGFTSKSGKPFNAFLVLKNDHSIGFEFPSK